MPTLGGVMFYTHPLARSTIRNLVNDLKVFVPYEHLPVTFDRQVPPTFPKTEES